MRLIVPIGMILCLLGGDASARVQRFHWPWERVPHRDHGHHHVRAEPDPPIDCATINKAVGVLSAAELVTALRLSTGKQRKTISDCINKAEHP